jgi:hypothetical protein
VPASTRAHFLLVIGVGKLYRNIEVNSATFFFHPHVVLLCIARTLFSCSLQSTPSLKCFLLYTYKYALSVQPFPFLLDYKFLLSWWLGPGFVSVATTSIRGMEDVVDLGETSQAPSNWAQADDDAFVEPDFFGEQALDSTAPSEQRGGGCGRGRVANGRSSSAPPRSVVAPLHKARGPNWTKA